MVYGWFVGGLVSVISPLLESCWSEMASFLLVNGFSETHI